MKRQAVFGLCIMILSIGLTSVNALESEDPFGTVSAWVTKSDFEATGMFENGSLKYYISNGTCLPEQEIRIQLNSDVNFTSHDLLIVIKLLQIQENGNLAEITRYLSPLDDYMKEVGGMWKSHLPYRNDSKYRLGVVLWNTRVINETLIYNVVGRLMSTLTVPYLPWFKFNATMFTDRSFYSFVEHIYIHIKNYGTRISFGEPYSLEVYENGRWVKSPWVNQSIWITILYNLSTNRTFNQRITSGFGILSSGHYRVIKGVDSKVLTAEFYVIDSPLIYLALSVLLLWKFRKKITLKKLLGFRED